MKKNEFENLKKGELVVYVGNTANKHTDKTRMKCTGLVLEVDGFQEVTNNYGHTYRMLRLVQPFVESDFEMYIGSSYGSLQFPKEISRK